MCDLTNPAFTDEDKAREFLEASRWPDGPVCPFCGQLDTVAKLGGKSMGPGWHYCSGCRDKFTVRVGTIYERSHIPLHKWLLATHLVFASKKGMSALQLSRMLGITYKSSWFMCHRIREAAAPTRCGPIGGENKVVEADESFIGGKAKNRAYAKKEPKKHAVLTLVERDGESRSFHIANVKAKTLREKIVTTVSRKSLLMTDELASYGKVGKEFANHGTVNHSANEFAKPGGFAHTNGGLLRSPPRRMFASFAAIAARWSSVTAIDISRDHIIKGFKTRCGVKSIEVLEVISNVLPMNPAQHDLVFRPCALMSSVRVLSLSAAYFGKSLARGCGFKSR